MSRVVWEERPLLRRPAVVLAFEGWGDAGESSSNAAQHLIDSGSAVLLGYIDPDDYYDFQVRRPNVIVDEFGTREIRWPEIEIWGVSLPHDDRDMVVITGGEPHTRWKQFTADVLTVMQAVGAEEVVTQGKTYAHRIVAVMVRVRAINH